MTTCQDIIDRAGTELALLGAGQVATGSDAALLLRYLQDGLNNTVLRADAPWRQVVLSSVAAVTAEAGDRITTGAYSAAPITLPTTYVDCYGETLPQDDLSRVQILGGSLSGIWVFPASKGAWAKINDLSIADDFPLGEEDVPGAAALTAVLALGAYGQGADPSPLLAQNAASWVAGMRARLYRPTNTPTDMAYLRMSNIGRRGVYDY